MSSHNFLVADGENLQNTKEECVTGKKDRREKEGERKGESVARWGGVGGVSGWGGWSGHEIEVGPRCI